MSELLSKFKYDTMYALSKSGKLRIYDISVEDYGDCAVVVTSSRLGKDGKVSEDRKTVSAGVNIGKSNETTYLEQAFRIANTKKNSLLDQGFTDTEPEAGEKFNTDSTGLMKPMLALPWNQKKVIFPCICQPKYDGVRCIISEGPDGNIKITSRQGKQYDIPHIREWAEQHRELLPLDGELYNHGDLTFQEIISAVKKHSDMTKKIRYVVYDLPIEGMCNSDRIFKLEENFYSYASELDSWPVYMSSYKIIYDMKELDEYHDECVANGYEGAIIRNVRGSYEFGFRSDNLIKLKKFLDSEFTVVDVEEATGRDAGTAVFFLETEDGKRFKARPIGSRELRKSYLDNRSELIGKQCTVKYQEFSDDGIPRFPVAISVRDYE